MTVFNKDSRLYEPIFSDPSVIPVINRFGVCLGVGDMTIGEACERHDINPEFFLAVINTYLNKDYFPDSISADVHIDMILDYLEKTDRYYLSIQLPNIERHFNLLLSRSRGESDSPKNLSLLNRFFLEVKEEMTAIAAHDTEYWFPLIQNDLPDARNIIDETLSEDTYRKHGLPFDNRVVEEKIQDLVSFFVIHLKGHYDHNLCVAVISAIFTLARDVRQNNRIRDRILRPLCIR